MSSVEAAVRGADDHPWRARARYFNSGNAFAQAPSRVPSTQFLAERDRAFDASTPTGLIPMDLSAELQTPFPATPPLVLSRYARIRAGESLTVEVRASAQLLCVLTGRGTTTVDGESTSWKAGDVLALPGAARVDHAADEDAVTAIFSDATNGIAKRLEDQIDIYTDSVDGLIKTRTDGFDRRIKQTKDRIEDAERRLTLYEQRLTQKYANLETLMTRLQGQGSSIRKRDEVHKMAQANKAFAHFRW